MEILHLHSKVPCRVCFQSMTSGLKVYARDGTKGRKSITPLPLWYSFMFKVKSMQDQELKQSEPKSRPQITKLTNTGSQITKGTYGQPSVQLF